MKNKKKQMDRDKNPFSYNNKSLFLSWIIIGILFAAIITRNSDILFLNIFFITYLITGILQMPADEDIKLTVKRTVDKEINDDCYSVNVKLNIINNGNKNICLIISDIHHEDIKITDGTLYLSTALAPANQTELRYTFESLRGNYKWDELTVKVCDPLGCIISEINTKTEAEISVHPRYKKNVPFQIRPWRTLSSPGCIPTRSSGTGTDFRGIREYQPGDSLKTLDWRMTAKHPHKFFTREFEQEKTADIIFVIDGRKNMELKTKNKNLFEIEISSTASLSEMFLHQGHRVGLYIAGKNILKVLPAYGKKQLHRILNCLAKAESGNNNYYKRLENLPIEHFSSKAIIFVLSPFDYNDIIFYRILKSHGLQVVLISPDSFDFAFQQTDLENNKIGRMALRSAKIERKLNLSLLSQLSISVIDWKIDQTLPTLVKKALYKPMPIRKL